jgi:hypothetical protein
VVHRDHLVTYGAMVASTRPATRSAQRSRTDIDQEMMRLNLAIVGQTLFSADVEDEAPQVARR